MPSYSHNRKTIGYCDRCSWEYPLSSLSKESVNGKRQSLKVCPSCFDGDHPQNFIGKRGSEDNQALMNSRADSGLNESRDGNTIIYDFTDGITQGAAPWRTYPGDLNGSVTHDSANGYLNLSWTNDDDEGISLYTLTGDDVIPTSTYSVVRVRFRVNTFPVGHYWVPSLYWMRTGDVNFVEARCQHPESIPELNVMGDQWHEMSFDATGHSQWENDVVGIRIDLFDYVPHGVVLASGDIDFDWVKIEERII